MFLNTNSAFFSPFDIQATVDYVKKTLISINLSLSCNIKMLLAEKGAINGQLDIIKQDLNDVKQKLDFLFRLKLESENTNLLADLKLQYESLEKQVSVFKHLNSLKNINLEKLKQ